MKHLSDDDLQNFLDRGSTAGAASEHLQRCEVCRDNLNRYRSLFSRLSEPPQLRLRPDFAGAVLSRIQGQRQHPTPLWLWAFVSGMLCLVITAGAGIYFLGLDWLSKAGVQIDQFLGHFRGFANAILGFAASLKLNYSLLVIGILSLALLSALDHFYIKSRSRSFTPKT